MRRGYHLHYVGGNNTLHLDRAGADRSTVTHLHIQAWHFTSFQQSAGRKRNLDFILFLSADCSMAYARSFLSVNQTQNSIVSNPSFPGGSLRAGDKSQSAPGGRRGAGADRQNNKYNCLLWWHETVWTKDC